MGPGAWSCYRNGKELPSENIPLGGECPRWFFPGNWKGEGSAGSEARESVECRLVFFKSLRPTGGEGGDGEPLTLEFTRICPHRPKRTTRRSLGSRDESGRMFCIGVIGSDGRAGREPVG